MKIFRKIKLLKNKKAFTLLEVLIAMSILVIILGGIVFFSVRSIQAHTRSQAMQSALENARFAIESINKMARTSELKNVEADKLEFESNYDGNKYKYLFDGRALTLNEVDLVGQSVGLGSKISITGSFKGNLDNLSDPEPNKRERGFVKTTITITYNSGGSPSESDSVTIQSGVSTRP